MNQKQKIIQIIENDARINYEKNIMNFIIQITCDYYDTNTLDLFSKTRRREVVKTRQVSMYLIRNNTKINLMDIARHFKKDHSTVIYSKSTIGNYIEWDKDLSSEIEYLQNKVDYHKKTIRRDIILEPTFYHINLDEIISIKLKNDKAIILKGFTSEELQTFDFNEAIKNESKRYHTDTGLSIIEKDIDKEEVKKNND